MNLTHRLIRPILRDETGATAIEYGLIVALIGIAMTVALANAGNSLSSTMNAAKVGMGG
ncbi:Flp family type IVb pilin [Tsuneonella sp. YG55]|uniref:Flp family type IVb pilin n=1 Tax=Tsuneonella litorea TaxID=2976475 RepID=A0A9X2W194_9SPHN|nr:Flp family type IVb pilin [Tsuneonella litorea]MCT2558146.1 Flp family type IVb pilin [Tsuneonella litorea]